jgi:hypothetical protein
MEFTIERGKHYKLQTNGNRTAQRFEGCRRSGCRRKADKEEALLKLSQQLMRLQHPTFETSLSSAKPTPGLGSVSCAACGKIYFIGR